MSGDAEWNARNFLYEDRAMRRAIGKVHVKMRDPCG